MNPPDQAARLKGFLHRRWRKLNTPPLETDDVPERMSNFTPRAQMLLALARKEADRLNHGFVGTEHLLLGMIRLREGAAVMALQQMGLDLESLRSLLEEQTGTGLDRKQDGCLLYTPRVARVLSLANDEARSPKQRRRLIGTGHILLGLLREGDSIAARLLHQFNISLKQTRKVILASPVCSELGSTGG